jgi:hypothetical protein
MAGTKILHGKDDGFLVTSQLVDGSDGPETDQSLKHLLLNYMRSPEFPVYLAFHVVYAMVFFGL